MTRDASGAEWVPLSVPDLGEFEADAVARVVRENWVSSAGPQVVELERKVADLAQRKFGVAAVNGTAALHMALMGLGIGAGDAVVVPDWTFAATANCVAQAGAKPLFVDVSASDWALDPDLVDQALAGEITVKAVIAVDPLGHSADFERLGQICKRYGIPLIEDAAAAIGAFYRGRPCGSFGLASTFSFNGNKSVTAGGGGMLVTDSEALAERVRHVSSTARMGQSYEHDVVGWNYRMPNLNAALALAQLSRLEQLISNKIRIAATYDRAIAGRNDLSPMPRPQHSKSSCWLYNVRVATEGDADSLVLALRSARIEARIFWRSLSRQRAWAPSKSIVSGVSQCLSGTVVSLPCSSSLSVPQQQRVLDVVQSWRGADFAA